MSKRRTRNLFLAISYIILGLVAVIVAASHAVAMYFSSTFLPGIDWNSFNWWIRKALYVSDFASIIVAVFLIYYGCSYLFKKRR